MRKWLETGTGALESWVWVLALLHTGYMNFGKLLPNLLMHFILHFDFMLLSVGTKSQCEDFGVEHSGSSPHPRSPSAKTVWRINDDSNQCLKSTQELVQLSECLELSGKMTWKIIIQWMRLVFILCHLTKQQEVSAIWKKRGKSEQ